MATRRPLVITSTGPNDLPAADILPIPTDTPVLLLPNASAPTGLASAVASVLGLNLAVTDTPALNKLAALYSGSKTGFSVLPSRSRLYQDVAATNPATTDGQSVCVIEDLSPNSISIATGGTSTAPLLRKSGGATYLEFDAVNDRYPLPASSVSTAGVTIIASFALRSNGNTPNIIKSLDAGVGLFLEFSGATRQPRLTLSGGTLSGSKVITSASAIPTNTRTTITATVDATDAKLYVNGVSVGTIATGGTMGVPSFYGICHHEGSTATPGNLYGLIVVQGVLSDADRAYYEGLIALNDQWITSYALQQTIAASQASLIASARSGLPRTLYQLPATITWSGASSNIETKVSTDILVPAGTLGPNGSISWDALTSCNSATNAKYLIIRFGPTGTSSDPIIAYVNCGGAVRAKWFDRLKCQNSPTDKIGMFSYASASISNNNNTFTVAPQSINVDNAVANSLSVWLRNGSNADTLNLHHLEIIIQP